MADKQHSDLFMMFCPVEGRPIAGESTVNLAIPGRSNELIKGFMPGKIFEISEFSFGLGGSRSSKLQKHLAMLSAAGGPPIDARGITKALGVKDDDGSDPTAVSEIHFSRVMDVASPVLLSHMIKRTFFERVAIIKRKAAGGSAGGDAFMRIDFRGVVLVDAAWSNGEPVKEDYAFQSRATTLRYRPQLSSGDLGDTIVGFKTLVPGEREAPL